MALCDLKIFGKSSLLFTFQGQASGTQINHLFKRMSKKFDWDVAVIKITRDRNMFEVCTLSSYYFKRDANFENLNISLHYRAMIKQNQN